MREYELGSGEGDLSREKMGGAENVQEPHPKQWLLTLGVSQPPLTEATNTTPASRDGAQDCC